ncbi:B12-binding domain-containing radical SAM protein [bacterium]|nr:B12-binding domain-containing radical SAM protein [bacterium]
MTVPIGLAYVAGSAREQGHDVQIVDAVASAPDLARTVGKYIHQGLDPEEIAQRVRNDVEVIGVACMFTQDWPAARGVLNALRARFPNAILVLGGEHATALPEISLRECPSLDFCVLGEGELTFADILSRVRTKSDARDVAGVAFVDDEGNFVKTEARKRIGKKTSVPRPAWDLFDLEPYLSSTNCFGVYRGRSIGVLGTRGCPYKCTFCSNPTMYGQLWVPRDPADVLDEIEDYIRDYRVENVDFYDLTMIIKRDWILKFCELIEERGLKFTWQLPSGTRSEAIDEEVAKALYRTGCRNIGYAPESGSPQVLKMVKKEVHLPRLIESIKGAVRAGLRIKINMIIGFPFETRSNILETTLFCWKLAYYGVDDPLISIFSPYPGTVLFDELRKEGRIPAINDEYYESMLACNDPTVPASFCRAVGGFELMLWRLLIMIVFYGISFVTRPRRLIQFIRSLWTGQGRETAIENRLLEIFALKKKKPVRMEIAAE